MEYQDKIIVCMDCQAEFIHTPEDQARYAERGFEHDPKRCPTCREKRRTAGARPRRGRPSGGDERRSGGGRRPPRSSGPRPPLEKHTVVCCDCGKTTEVPFKPDPDRPVYCRDCYRARKPVREDRPSRLNETDDESDWLSETSSDPSPEGDSPSSFDAEPAHDSTPAWNPKATASDAPSDDDDFAAGISDP